uniref:Uncharacterized protein n=1 Tax=Aegilops tauschii subsp. strangulata TaxID=200361 RepID=A0A453KFI6_AEGTS
CSTTPAESTSAPRPSPTTITAPSTSATVGRNEVSYRRGIQSKNSRWWWCLNICSNDLNFHRFAVKLHIVVPL